MEPRLQRQLGLQQFDDDGLALLLEVDAGTHVGQVDDYLAFAVAPAFEVDIAHTMRLRRRLGVGEVSRLSRGCGRGCGDAGERDDHVLAFHGRIVFETLVEVQH